MANRMANDLEDAKKRVKEIRGVNDILQVEIARLRDVQQLEKLKIENLQAGIEKNNQAIQELQNNILDKMQQVLGANAALENAENMIPEAPPDAPMFDETPLYKPINIQPTRTAPKKETKTEEGFNPNQITGFTLQKGRVHPQKEQKTKEEAERAELNRKQQEMVDLKATQEKLIQNLQNLRIQNSKMKEYPNVLTDHKKKQEKFIEYLSAKQQKVDTIFSQYQTMQIKQQEAPISAADAPMAPPMEDFDLETPAPKREAQAPKRVAGSKPSQQTTGQAGGAMDEQGVAKGAQLTKISSIIEAIKNVKSPHHTVVMEKFSAPQIERIKKILPHLEGKNFKYALLAKKALTRMINKEPEVTIAYDESYNAHEAILAAKLQKEKELSKALADAKKIEEDKQRAAKLKNIVGDPPKIEADQPVVEQKALNEFNRNSEAMRKQIEDKYSDSELDKISQQIQKGQLPIASKVAVSTDRPSAIAPTTHRESQPTQREVKQKLAESAPAKEPLVFSETINRAPIKGLKILTVYPKVEKIKENLKKNLEKIPAGPIKTGEWGINKLLDDMDAIKGAPALEARLKQYKEAHKSGSREDVVLSNVLSDAVKELKALEPQKKKPQGPRPF